MQGKITERLDTHRCVAVKCNDPGSVAEVKRLCECLYFKKSIVEDEGEQKVTVPKDVKKCRYRLLFGYPDVFAENKTVAKMLEFQRRVRAIVIDEAHLVLQWYLYILFKNKNVV